MLKKLIAALLPVILLTSPVFAQMLPATFDYQARISEESGDAVYILNVNPEAVKYSDKKDLPFEALLFEVTPAQNFYDLILMNAKKEYQFTKGENEGGKLTIGDEVIELPEYQLIFQRPATVLKLEAAGLRITKEIFDKIIGAERVTIELGPVRYVLDRDNIVALHYFGRQIGKPVAKSADKPVVTSESGRKAPKEESGARVYRTGPKGGCYYVNSSGKKTYVAKSYCN
jgi:hypothetical protein